MSCKGKFLYEVEEVPEGEQPVITEGEDKSIEAALKPSNPLTGMGTSWRQGTDNTDVDDTESETEDPEGSGTDTPSGSGTDNPDGGVTTDNPDGSETDNPDGAETTIAPSSNLKNIHVNVGPSGCTNCESNFKDIMITSARNKVHHNKGVAEKVPQS